MRASIIIPVVRTENIKRLCDAIKRNAGIPEEEYEIIVKIDENGIGFPRMIADLQRQAKSENVMFLGDDTLPQKDFLLNALKYMESFKDGWGCVKLNDNDGQPHVPAHWLCSKKMLPVLGGEFAHLGYTHAFCDNEMGELAQEAGRYIFGENARIVHNHPAFGTGEDDEYYQRIYADEVLRSDQKLFLKRKVERGSFKIAVCLPTTNERDHNAFWFSFTKMAKPAGQWVLLTPKIKNGESAGETYSIATIRDDLCKKALSTRIAATHIVMLDTDQIFYDPLTLHKFIMAQKPFICAPVHRRYPPFEPLIKRKDEAGKYYIVPKDDACSGEVIEVDSTGTGAICIESRYLLDMELPWFEFGERENGDKVGEDIYFCEKWRELGNKIYCDTSIQIGHLSLVGIDRTYYEIWKKVQGIESPGAERKEV